MISMGLKSFVFNNLILNDINYYSGNKCNIILLFDIIIKVLFNIKKFLIKYLVVMIQPSNSRLIYKAKLISSPWYYRKNQKIQNYLYNTKEKI